MSWDIIEGDCRDVMRGMDAESVDSIVTDPPYGLGFMGKEWDHGIPGVPFWEAALRVAKPGAFMLAFGGTRTFHRLTCAIEDAGWEIRDCIMWVYGSGFPKSLDISKAIDKAAGVEREVVAIDESKLRPNRIDRGLVNAAGGSGYHTDNGATKTVAATDAAREWDGWGTALKPAWEPIIVAMKPLDGTFAENAQRHGVAGLNIDGCRIEAEGRPHIEKKIGQPDVDGALYGAGLSPRSRFAGITNEGRWPANLIHDGSKEVVGLFPTTQSRFFYTAKASRAERNSGSVDNRHPTVKPVSLLKYLCRLVRTPTKGVILDPFCGSGTTGIGGVDNGQDFIGIDDDAESCELARKRIAAFTAQWALALDT